MRTRMRVLTFILNHAPLAAATSSSYFGRLLPLASALLTYDDVLAYVVDLNRVEILAVCFFL